MEPSHPTAVGGGSHRAVGSGPDILERAVSNAGRAALPEHTTGIGWSDHASFWSAGYPAIMVTDTALFRYHHYHRATDTPDKVDFDRLARVVAGLGRVTEALATR